jgi:protein arginine N-methyltransferase 1
VAETYTIGGHGAMLSDRVRMDAYEAALAATVRPGDVVLDVGTGTGIFALLACRMGARQVYAVEPGDSIHLGRAAARDSGYADRIRFIQGISTEIELPERADVMVSDLRGLIPLFEQHIPSVIDARERLLVPGSSRAATRSSPRRWRRRTSTPASSRPGRTTRAGSTWGRRGGRR